MIEGTITTVSRTGRDAMLYLGPDGQIAFRLQDAPPGIEAVVGTRVRCDAHYVMVGNTRWAKREGWSRIRLVPRVSE
jgi:hypothetical protein